MTRTTEATSDRRPAAAGRPSLVDTDALKPDGYDGSCLRPSGMCELGGSCDICWYSPDHPRFHESQE
jgi:hypothetical protein